MKELELTSNAALTDAVYETALNGSFLEVKLVAGSVGDDEPRGMQPEYECYHISYPDKKDTILFEQPLDAADDKVTVYDLGKKIKSIEGCCHKTLTKGESRTATARKVVAHGPMWIYVAIAVGMDKAGTESPFMIVQGAGTYGSEDTTENEMIGYANGRIHEMTALLVRRARLEKLHLASIRAGYYNPQIQISAESETKRSIFREKDKTKRSKKESAQHSKSRNKSFVMTSVSAL